jgi:hypothetical protein
VKAHIRTILTVLAARLTEQSTWQGIGFLVALSGSKLGLGMDWGQAAGLGGVVSALIKIVLPDPVVKP